jgi:pyridoxamine 5'-phosphate oxidase
MPLFESRAPADPLTMFRRWYGEAERAGVPQPDAMTLATNGRAGPSARMVLFKGLEDGAFTFYTNYESRKGRDLASSNRAALVFHWSATRGEPRRLARLLQEPTPRRAALGAGLEAESSRRFACSAREGGRRP